MSKKEIDQYVANVEEPKRSTLQELRETILSIIPEAEQCIFYQVPAFKLHGQAVAGFAAFKNHLSYLPFSGSVIPKLQDELTGYASTAGALHFPVDKPLPKKLIKKLIEVRVGQVLQRHASSKPSSSGKRGARPV